MLSAEIQDAIHPFPFAIRVEKKDIEKYIENVRCVDNAVRVVAVYVL